MDPYPGRSWGFSSHSECKDFSPLDTDKLSSEKLMLRGFHEQGEKALGSITLPLQFGDLRTEAKFHIIDSDTSDNH